MTDLHTHILPGMDDGAPDVETSLALLRAEYAQGVTNVALTPHFYRDREEPQHFLERRQKSAKLLMDALMQLSEEERSRLPRLTLGAEVAWMPGMAEWKELPKLCYTNTTYLQMELPFFPWNEDMFHQIYSLMSRTGLTPVIAHLDRYFGTQSPRQIEALLDLNIPFQLSAESLLHFSTRRKALRLLENRETRLLISDCHSIQHRPPNIGTALDVICKKLGEETVQSISYHTDALLTGEE